MRHHERPAATVSSRQRHNATERHQQAIDAINTMFDRLDDLAEARNHLTGLEPLGQGDDPVRDAESLLERAEDLGKALVELPAAALTAAEHRRRGDLADDVGTKPAVLFPRHPRVAAGDGADRLSSSGDAPSAPAVVPDEDGT